MPLRGIAGRHAVFPKVVALPPSEERAALQLVEYSAPRVVEGPWAMGLQPCDELVCTL